MDEAQTDGLIRSEFDRPKIGNRSVENPKFGRGVLVLVRERHGTRAEWKFPLTSLGRDALSIFLLNFHLEFSVNFVEKQHAKSETDFCFWNESVPKYFRA